MCTCIAVVDITLSHL
uniref:Leader peptide 1 n=1 Tax=Streptococcus pyogenes TaxID=1314 RepID=O07478_STRPY|nr:leader peptide 1 [Streptococcus pyogenes]ACA52062.1 leader peptide 1 [Streptococcus pyogenes]ACA52065.1 leader peptide 1 [Streptococcus pyogenes]ACA52068.1 leader peptide 1 [Streptococcus pyogenes]ACA52071.1 leader peptide 1 [Streptococcus pyogenes]